MGASLSWIMRDGQFDLRGKVPSLTFRGVGRLLVGELR